MNHRSRFPANLISGNLKTILMTAWLLTAFAIAGATLVGLTHEHTRDDIRHNQKLTLLRKLNTIVPASEYDNDLLADTLQIDASALLGTSETQTVYRARKHGQNVAVVIPVVAPNGYNGPIEMLVGIYRNGRIAGVRIIQHRETPGLGDAIEKQRSNWLDGFNDKSLTTPDEKRWKVKRDGGVFDQFTGATITPRAVVKAIHAALLYYQQNRDALFRVDRNETEERQP